MQLDDGPRDEQKSTILSPKDWPCQVNWKGYTLISHSVSFEYLIIVG